MDFRRREVERVAQPGRQREVRRDLPVVLDEVFLRSRPLLDLLLLQIDREGLHLSEEETRQRRPGPAGARLVAADGVERERPGGGRRLDDVQALPAPVDAGLQEVAPLHPGQRVGDLRHAGREVRRGVGRRAELLVAADEEGRQRVGETRARRNAGEAQRRAGRGVERRGGPVNGAARVAEADLVEERRREGALVVGRERPRVRQLRPERAGRHAAAVGERRDRREVVVEVRQTPEQVVAIRRRVIEADVPLVLVVDLGRGAAVIVGRAGGGRQRVVRQERDGDRIELRRRNRVAGKRGSYRAGRGIEDGRHLAGDRFREDTLALQRRRHRRDDGARDVLALSLIVGEEERPIAPQGTAGRGAELVAAVLRLRPGGLEEVARVERFVAQEFERVAVQRVRAGARREIDDAAVEAPELGGRAVALDPEFLDRVDHGEECHLPRLWLQHRDAVEEILVRARPAAVDARQLRTRRKRDARRERRERDEGASVEGQRRHAIVRDDGAEAGGLGPERRRRRGDRDPLLNAAGGEPDVGPRRFARRHMKAAPRHRREPVERDLEPVVARRQDRGAVEAVHAGRHAALLPGRRVRDRDRCRRDRRAVRVHHEAAHRSRSDLAGAGAQPQPHTQQHAHPPSLHTHKPVVQRD